MREGRFPQGRRLAAYFTGPRRPAVLAALIALGVLLTIWWGSRLWYKESLLIHERQDAMANLAPHGNALTIAIDRRLALLKGLRAFVEVHASAPTLEKEFKTFAAELHAGTRGIRNFTIAPGGVNRFVYPLAGNETVPGHDLLRDPRPNVRADVKRAIQSRRVTLSGPYELRQSGSGLVARLALYQNDSFWGLVAMALDVAPILEEAGLKPTTGGLNLALRNGAGQVFFGESSIFAAQPVVYRVQLPEGSWELAAVPSGGWGVSTRQALIFFDGATLAIAFLMSGLVYLVANRQARLALAVRERTQEITKINEQLEADIAERKRIEEELRIAQQELETRVQERTKELAKANDELQLEIRGRRQVEQALRESERRFRAIFNQTYQLTGLLKPDGTLLETNETSLDFRRLKRSDVVGRPFWETPWWDISTEAQDHLKTAIATAARGNFVRYEVDLLGPDGSVVTFDFSLKPLADDHGQVVLLIPEGRNITELKRIENEIRLLLTVPQEVAIAKDFPAAVAAVLRRVCEATGWDFGEAWIPRSDGSLLERSAVWHTSTKGLERFRKLSEEFTLSPGVALPGRVWLSRQPEWVRDISADPASPRAPIAKEVGLRAAVGIPILADEQVIAILTFLMFQPREEDARLIEVLSGVAMQLGLAFQRKQAEEALGRHEAELAAIVDSSTRVIFLKDTQGRYLLINREYEKLFHVTRNEIKGKTDDEIFPPETAARLRENDLQVLEAGGPLEFEEIVPLDDGPHTYLANKFPLRDSQGVAYGVCGIATDITERKLLEEDLKAGRTRAENWFQRLIETTQDAVISIDRQGRVVLFNPAAERIFGYSKAEITRQQVNVLMAEPYASEHDNYMALFESTGEKRAIGRIRTVAGRRKNGDSFPIELSVTEVRSDGDVRYAAFIRDISEKTRLQEQLIESERLAAIGTTASLFAHEIGNPLNGMSMTIQLLERRLARHADGTDEKITAAVKRLKDEIGRLTQLLEDFRSLSRRENYILKPISLQALAREVCTLEEESYRTQGIQVEQDFPPDLPLVAADRDKLKQALLNLCKNAVEAMPNGGRLTLRAYSSGERLNLEIIDTGVGIPAGVDIFEPFTTSKPSGTGLGLVIVRQILVAHRGSIGYSSEPGKGTIFRLTLPSVLQEPAQKRIFQQPA